MTRARLVRIGNSRGIRLPKLLIEQAGLVHEVELRVRKGAIEIASVSGPRSGWAEAARELGREGGDRLLDPETLTEFDQVEWQW